MRRKVINLDSAPCSSLHIIHQKIIERDVHLVSFIEKHTHVEDIAVHSVGGARVQSLE